MQRKKNDCLTCHQKSTDLLINAKSYCYVLLWNVLFFRFHFYRIWTGDLWQNARHLRLKYPSSFRIISCVFYLILFWGWFLKTVIFANWISIFLPQKSNRFRAPNWTWIIYEIGLKKMNHVDSVILHSNIANMRWAMGYICLCVCMA